MQKLGRELESEGDDRSNRRKSVLMKSMNNLTKVVNSVRLHVVQEPDISHLYLQDMEPRHVIVLIQGAHKVMLESKFHFKIQKRISKGIIATMCVRMRVTEIEFYAMKFDEVVLGLAKLIRHVSVFDFGKLLMENLSCE
jgi:hypothetical protein